MMDEYTEMVDVVDEDEEQFLPINKDVPYEIKERQCLSQCLAVAKQFVIPEQSRAFSWTPAEYVEEVVNKILFQYDSRRSYSLGQLKLFDPQQNGQIYRINDGQHRFTILLLMLYVVGSILDKNEDRVLEKLNETYLCMYVSQKRKTPPKNLQPILKQYGWKNIPKLLSKYSRDYEAFGNIINGLYKYQTSSTDDVSMMKVKGNESDNSDTDSQHDMDELHDPSNKVCQDANDQSIMFEPNTNSKLYAAYACIVNTIHQRNYSHQRLYALNTYLLQYIRFDMYIIKDFQYALEDAYDNNNIQKPVCSINLLKNKFAAVMGYSQLCVLHENQTFIEKQLHDFGIIKEDEIDRVVQSVYCIAQRLLLCNETEYKKHFNNVHNLSLQIHERFMSVFQHTVKLLRILQTDSYGKILVANSTGFEVIFLFLNGLMSVYNEDTLKVIIKMLVAFIIRTNTRLSMNQFRYMHHLIDLTVFRDVLNSLQKPEFVAPTSDEIVNKIARKLNFMMYMINPKLLHKQATIDQWCEYRFKYVLQTRIARAALILIVKSTQEFEMILDASKIDLEHIHPQRAKATDPQLQNQELKHTIGNFTVLLSGNSQTTDLQGKQLIGNRGLRNKSFKQKVPSYAQSNIEMTKQLSNFQNWTDAMIIDRSIILSTYIESFTRNTLRMNQFEQINWDEEGSTTTVKKRKQKSSI